MTQWTSVLRLLRRRGWALVMTTVLVVLVAVALSPREGRRYTAEASLFVPSGATREGPGNAFDANRLALTYVSLIPRDDAILGHIGRTISEPVSSVRRQLQVSTVGDTSILRVTYTSSSAAKARGAVRAAAQAITGTVRVAETIPPGTVVLASLGEQPPTQPPSTSGVIGLGVILGLALGIVVAVALERANRRVDDVAVLDALAPCPVSTLDELSPLSASAVIDRLKALANPESTQRSVTSVSLALMAPRPGHLDLSRQVGSFLSLMTTLAADRSHSPTQPVRSDMAGSSDQRSSHGALQGEPGYSVRSSDIEVVPSGAPRGGEGGEVIALNSDVTVLVVRAGTAVSDVRETIVRLEEFDVIPAWILFVSPKAEKRLAQLSSPKDLEEARVRPQTLFGTERPSRPATSRRKLEAIHPHQHSQDEAVSVAEAQVVPGMPASETDGVPGRDVAPSSLNHQESTIGDRTHGSASDKSDDEPGRIGQRDSANVAEEAWANVLEKVAATRHGDQDEETTAQSTIAPPESLLSDVRGGGEPSTLDAPTSTNESDQQLESELDEAVSDEFAASPKAMDISSSESRAGGPGNLPADRSSDAAPDSEQKTDKS